MEIIAYIKEIEPGKWRVFSEKGKNLGTFNSKKKAKKRLSQVEYFKHKNSFFQNFLEKISQESTTTFSATMRNLRKNNPNQVISFLKNFQKSFENAIEENVDDAEQAALLETKYEME